VKVYPDKLPAELSKGLQPLYIISGDETLLANECADAVRASCKQQGFSERELFHVDSASYDWEPVLQSLNSMSLFSEQKLVEIRCGKYKPNNKSFLEYFQQSNPDTVVLVICDKLDASTQKTKWFKQLESHSILVSVWPIEGNNLTRWLQQRAKQKGVRLSPDAIHLLQDRIEGNLLAADQELAKLALLFNDQEINEEMLLEAVADSSRYNIFALSDKVLNGDSQGSLKILRGLLEEGTAETVILWTLSKELRTLLGASEAISQGQQANWALKQQGVWDKRQPLYQQALKRLSPPKLKKLLQKASQTDLSIKGMGQLKPQDELANICLGLCAN